MSTSNWAYQWPAYSYTTNGQDISGAFGDLVPTPASDDTALKPATSTMSATYVHHVAAGTSEQFKTENACTMTVPLCRFERRMELVAPHRPGVLSAGARCGACGDPVMYVRARQRLTIAERIASRALRTDTIEAVTCAYLSFVVVIGLAAQALLNAWWVDGVTSLAIVFLLLKEAREAWRGG